jgi:hypothetical protein
MGVEQSEAPIEKEVLDAGRAVGRVDLAQYGCSVVAAPVNGAIKLPQRRLPAVRRAAARIGWRPGASRYAGERRTHGNDGAFGDFIPIEATFADATHWKRCAGPDRPGVELRFGLEDGDAPGGEAAQDRPVERRWAAIAGRAGMHDQAHLPLPDGGRNSPLQKRRKNQIRPE